MTKKAEKKSNYMAIVKYEVEVEVPLKASTIEEAGIEAMGLKPGAVHQADYEAQDYGSLTVESIYKPFRVV